MKGGNVWGMADGRGSESAMRRERERWDGEMSLGWWFEGKDGDGVFEYEREGL
jgi:hypothetical protein